MQLAREPLCAKCLPKGYSTEATVADHNPPHRGDLHAFWHGPLQSLCKLCHDRDKQREEARGFSDSTGADGWPTDPRHPANANVCTRVARQAGEFTPTPGVKSLGPSDARPAAPNRTQRREMTTGGRNGR